MKIYVDNDFRCHSDNDGTMREIELDYFDGKCKEYIEGYRYVPDGETWTRSDGVVFRGEMICPAVDSRILEQAQRDFEHEKYLDAVSALKAIYGGETDV